MGNTCQQALQKKHCFRRDHPHVRGEYMEKAEVKTYEVGSPPQVHPHVRGEYCSWTWTAVSLRESPPRAWGIRPEQPARHTQGRITPTCVGNTKPRVRICTGGSDSLPHAWGIPLLFTCCQTFSGITPTCVGNTIRPHRNEACYRAHPHVRGEYYHAILCFQVLAGIIPTCVGNALHCFLFFRAF